MKIRNNSMGVLRVGDINLLPGENDVPGFEHHMNHPDIIEKQKTKNDKGQFQLEVVDKGHWKGYDAKGGVKHPQGQQQQAGHNDGTNPPPDLQRKAEESGDAPVAQGEGRGSDEAEGKAKASGDGKKTVSKEK